MSAPLTATSPKVNTDAPTLSVILPNFNHGKLIARAIEALVAQRRQPEEIIVVDDGSTDDSLSVIRQLMGRYSAVKLIVHPQNLGTIAALTRGLEEAQGRYVYLAASDDWTEPDFFDLAVNTLEANPQAGLFCGEARLVHGKTGALIATRPSVRPIYCAGMIDADRARALLGHIDNWILTACTVFRRDSLIAAGLDQRLGSFADGFLARKIALTRGSCYAPRVVATWSIYPDSYSRRTALDPDQAHQALDLISTRLATDPAFPSWYARIFADRWRFASARLALEAMPMNRDLLWSMAGRSTLDRIVLAMVWYVPFPQLTRYAALAWLWVRLRPTSLVGVIRTALARRMART
jgi:glycosyltransferase involved in cell wall biosynthesis